MDSQIRTDVQISAGIFFLVSTSWAETLNRAKNLVKKRTQAKITSQAMAAKIKNKHIIIHIKLLTWVR